MSKVTRHQRPRKGPRKAARRVREETDAPPHAPPHPRPQAATAARAWMAARVRETRYRSPARAGFLLIATLSAMVIVAAWMAGVLGDMTAAARQFSENRLAASGFVLEHVDIRGAARTDLAEIRRRLMVEDGELIFHFDPHAAQESIAALPWVRHTSVLRLLPNRIVVIVEEREPLALWRGGAGRRLQVLDDTGAPITGARPGDHAGLIVVEGGGAPAAAPALAVALSRFPELADRAAGFRRVSARRWSMLLDDGAEVLLPARTAAGLERLQSLQDQERILDWPFEALDLRNGDLMVRARPAQPRGRGA